MQHISSGLDIVQFQEAMTGHSTATPDYLRVGRYESRHRLRNIKAVELCTFQQLRDNAVLTFKELQFSWTLLIPGSTRLSFVYLRPQTVWILETMRLYIASIKQSIIVLRKHLGNAPFPTFKEIEFQFLINRLLYNRSTSSYLSISFCSTGSRSGLIRILQQCVIISENVKPVTQRNFSLVGYHFNATSIRHTALISLSQMSAVCR